MARGTDRPSREPHQRFGEWLETLSDEDPPRDLAVHAAVCVDCQQQIAAVDMLTAIDLARAGAPPTRPLPTSGWIRSGGRVVVVVGGVVALTAVGLGGWRLILASDLWGGPGTESPTQAVLGGTGKPEPTPAVSEQATAQPATVDPTPSEAAATAAPPQGVATTIPQPPAPPTAQPTVRPSATLRPTRTPAPTAVPTPAPTAVPTATPTPAPTPAPTPTQPGPP